LNTVGIIIVVYNQKHFLEGLYKSLQAQSFKDFNIYFIDNASSDNSLQYSKVLNGNNKLNIKYFALNKNTGYAGGNNTGAKEAVKDGCKYLFILNNDMILDKNCINELVKLMESDSSIACAGPLVLFNKQPDTIQEFGGKINFRSASLKKHYSGKNIYNIKLPEILETDFISGGAMFIKSSVFVNAGMFEEAYFAYLDEIDLSKRIKSANAGKLLATSRAVVWHNHNWSKDNKNSFYVEYFLMERNKYLYYHKYGLYYSMFLMLLNDLFKFPWRLKWFIKVCNFKLGLYYLKGMLYGLLNKKGKPKFIL